MKLKSPGLALKNPSKKKKKKVGLGGDHWNKIGKILVVVAAGDGHGGVIIFCFIVFPLLLIFCHNFFLKSCRNTSCLIPLTFSYCH